MFSLNRWLEDIAQAEADARLRAFTARWTEPEQADIEHLIAGRLPACDERKVRLEVIKQAA